MKIKVFVTSHQQYDGKKVWHSIKKRLIELYEISDKKYELVDEPNKADVILVGSERIDDWCQHVFENEIVKKDPTRAFTIHDADSPMFLHHGIYSSNRKSLLSYGRVRTGSYTLFGKEIINPFIQKHILIEANMKEKEYLFSFLGRSSHPVRQRLFSQKFRRSDIYIEDTSHFNLWSLDANIPNKIARQYFYYETLLKSKFALCPRGTGTGSIRLFEAMQLGIPPVIISDRWIFPKGPNWSEFSIVIKEKNLDHLEEIIESHESEYQIMGRVAKRAYDEYFAETVYFNYLVESCLDIMQTQNLPEWTYWKFSKLILLMLRLRNRLRIQSRIRKILGLRAI